jgi:hypothetical protein
MWTTKVTDPNGNDSVMSFAEDGATTTSTTSATYNFYETQRQSYQGSVGSGLLLTTVTCYHGNTSSCATTTVSSPINNKSVTLQFPNNGLQAKTATTYNTFGLVTEVDQYAYASGAPTVLAQKTQIIYASLGNGIVDRPSSISVKDGGGAYLSYTLYNYDETAYPIHRNTAT